MKSKYVILLLTALAVSGAVTGQTLKERFGHRKEVYFSFPIRSTTEIRDLTKIISIDNVRNDTVWAYANMEGFLHFSEKGYNVTFLPHPGDGPGIAMIDHYDYSPDMPATVWNFYPTYEAYESLMTQFQSTYPSICKLYTIGTLTSGRKLLAVKISDNVNADETEPEFFYTSSMHGDETTGYVLMLHLIDYLLTNYGTNTEATDLINNMEIFINPLANPDGTYAGGNNTVNGATRYNVNGVDLNRNYPDIVDGPHPDGNPWQEETVAFMDFAAQRHFVASANFHGGAEVFNYPWDTWPTLAADDAWWYFAGREYADTVHAHAPSTYMDDLDNGVTNGYAWYEANGSRQDWMNYWQHCREVTIEISNTKLLPPSQLETHWNYNWRSFILFMKEAIYGIHGVVTDLVTGSPVAAKIFMTGHDFDNSEVYASATLGDYHRLLKADVYDMEVSAPCYQTFSLTGIGVTDHALQTINIQLTPGSGVITATPVSITETSAVSGGEVICDGGIPVSARGVCWGITINPTTAGSHTTDGSGMGTFISNITGLSPNTTYYVRAYCTNAAGTSYGDNIILMTACGIISLPLTENFAGSSFPACWSQQISGTGASNSWSVSATSHAGGTAWEMKSTYQNVNPATSRLVTVALNTTGYTQLDLSFRHMLDAFGSGVTLKVQSSTDGLTWSDEAWSVATTNSNIPATQINTTVVNNLNSQTTYIAFTVAGNLYQYDYWYIDNVSVTGTSVALPVVTTTAVTEITTTTAISGGNVTFGGTSPVTARGVCWSTSANPTVADSHTTDGTGTGSFISNITGLSANTTYHVRAYATNSTGTSYGTNLTFNTPCTIICSFPWSEGFENGGTIPVCWTQEQINNSGISWTFITGNGNGHPSTAHGGSYNACLKDNTITDNKTRLITPCLNLNGVIEPQLTFWHTQAVWSGDQDQLAIYYKSGAGNWTLITTYTSNVSAWTMRTLPLPNPGESYYIAFEGNAKYGYGVCIDDISVTGSLYRTLKVTAFLEGLYLGGNTMRAASDESGPRYGAGIADKVTIELHSSPDYSNILFSSGPVNLSTTGTIQVNTVPAALNENYYVTIRHKSSIETTSSLPLSFSEATTSYDFSIAATQAYGSNQLNHNGTGVYVIWSGDVNQDGIIDSGDMNPVDNASTLITLGYVNEDVNGDGIVDSGDMIFVDNNSTFAIIAKTP